METKKEIKTHHQRNSSSFLKWLLPLFLLLAGGFYFSTANRQKTSVKRNQVVNQRPIYNEQYIIVDGLSKEELKQNVNKAIENGYEPIGGMLETSENNYSQSMFKKEN